MKRSSILLFSLLLLPACATEESFQVRVMRPAPVDLASHRTIALDRFEGEHCGDLSEALSEALRLSVHPLTGDRSFEVLDRNDVDRMLDMMRESRSGALDEEAMATLQRWREAKVLLKGFVERHDYTEELEETEWVDKTGVAHLTTKRFGIARVVVTIEARGGDGGDLLDRVTIEQSASQSTTAVDGTPAPLNDRALLATARNSVVSSYLERVLPHEEWVAVHLKVDGDLPQLEVGNGFARVGDWNAALESYEQALATATGELAELQPKALFNCGVALLYLNRFDDARARFKAAYATGRDPRALNELARVDRREAEAHALQDQADRAASPGR